MARGPGLSPLPPPVGGVTGPTSFPGARIAFGSRAGLAERYAGWLVGPGVDRGLLGPREADRVWPRHLLNCAAAAELVPVGARVVDLGSGAGLPGVPLALARPDLRVTLVEPQLRRARFLHDVLADLELPRLGLVRGRHDGLAPGCVDVVVVRAVAPLERLLPWALPLLRAGGILLALKGEGAAAEVAAAAHLLAARRAHAEVVVCPSLADRMASHGVDPTVVVRVTQVGAGTRDPVGLRGRRA